MRGFAGNRNIRTKSALVLTALVLTVLSGLPIAVWGEARPVPSYTATLTKELKNKRPATVFHCRDKVFLAFTWLGLRGRHKVTALWFNPRGRQQDHIDLEFIAEQPKVENWVALTFRDESGPTIPFLPDLFSSNLSGDWRVKILLDGNFLETLPFRVHCG